MKLRNKLSNSEIEKLTGLARNTVKKWLKAPGDEVPRYRRGEVEGKLTAYKATLHQALKADSHGPKHARRDGRALMNLSRHYNRSGGLVAGEIHQIAGALETDLANLLAPI